MNRECCDSRGAVRRRPAVIEAPHVVDESGLDMFVPEAAPHDIDSSRALGTVTEDRGRHIAGGGEFGDNRLAVAIQKEYVAKWRQPLAGECLVLVVAQFNAMDARIWQVLGKQVCRLPARPSALNHYFNTKPAAGVNDQRHLGIQDAARFIWLGGDGFKQTSSQATSSTITSPPVSELQRIATLTAVSALIGLPVTSPATIAPMAK